MIAKMIRHPKFSSKPDRLEKNRRGGYGCRLQSQGTKLKRDVAIKFLPCQIAASEEECERLKIEAQAEAGLSHPNIATINRLRNVY